MATRELNILISAKNMASKVLGQVKGDVNGLDGAARRASSNMGRNIGIGVAAVGAGLAVQIKAGVDSLVELERVENLTAAALKSTGNIAGQSAEEIRKRSEAMEAMSGVDDKVIQNAQNLLLTFTNVREDAFEPTMQAALNLNAALGGGDEGLQGTLMQVAKAMNDPVRGMTALRRSGVSFTQAQQDQVKAMVEANDIMGAQAIILGELETQFGGAAEAANQGAGAAQKKFADAIEDMQMALAQGFLPLIEKVSGKLQEMVANPAFLPAVEKFGDTIAGALDAAIDFGSSVPWGEIGAAMEIAGTGAKMAMDAFLGAPPWLQTAILTGWGLNKLTGGALGSIVGELGKGIIKGVLNMNAAVVNVNGRVVNGPGGGPSGGPGGGRKPGIPWLKLGGGAAGLALMLSGSDDPNAQRFADQKKVERGEMTREEFDRLWNHGEVAQNIADLTARSVGGSFAAPRDIGSGWEERFGRQLSTLSSTGAAPSGPVRRADVSEQEWERLKSEGWKGRAGDSMEALYPPAMASDIGTVNETLQHLARTNEMGLKGVGTSFQVGLTNGLDPLGDTATRILARAENPLDPPVLTEVKGHIAGLEEIQAQYLANGDVHLAEKVQTNIDTLHALIGTADALNAMTMAQGAADAASDAAMLGSAERTMAAINTKGDATVSKTSEVLNSVHTLNASEGARFADLGAKVNTTTSKTGEVLGAVGAMHGTLSAKNFNPLVKVDPIINTTVHLALQTWQQTQVSSIRANSNSGGFI